jgi:flagellar biosynthesis protein FlhF
MRLKTFYAKNMTEAMQQVKETLGEDAIIVATRDENGGASVRVTAAVEPVDDLPDPYPDDYEPIRNRQAQSFSNDRVDYLQYDNEEDYDGQLTEELTDVMLRHVVPNDVMDNILATAAMTGLGNAESALIAALDHLYSFHPMPHKSNKAMMLVGAPGAGKTLMIAKMATQAVMNGLNVAVVTTDTVRAGGVEQLNAFTKILKVPLQTAKTQADLKTILSQTKNHDIVLIDTAGTNPHDPDDMARIARLIDSGPVEPILAMTAGVDAEESSEIARSYALLGTKRMMATRLDLARRLGGLLAAAQKGGMSFCDISFTPRVTDGIDALNATKLAGFLIKPDHILKSYHTSPTQNSRKTVGRSS